MGIPLKNFNNRYSICLMNYQSDIEAHRMKLLNLVSRSSFRRAGGSELD